ncbi:hypothetical protein K0M31_000401 [Melipona bicolor]|uniref:Uncharacterized protein n=1 Tax=Melipona bicolor TaxID=60889 RepID=A0AA40KWM2_9HYME|nr:hypothetical protein K0M31_000401 [Melipona bicolor]
MQNKRRFASPFARPPLSAPRSWSFHGASVSARHDTGQSREITWREAADGAGERKGKKRRDRVNAGRRRGRDDDEEEREEAQKEGSMVAKGEKKHGRRKRERRERREKKKKKEEKREWCACLGAKSWASRAQAWPRLTLERLRSEVIIEHEPPWGSQPSPPRCLPTLRSKTASLKTFANSERATNRERRASPDFTTGEVLE